MLKTTLIHPDILHALGTMGHGSQILISDGNYPHVTAAPPSARKVFLNLSPGVVTVPNVLETLLTAVPIEEAFVMTLPDDAEPPVWIEYRDRLGDVPLQRTERFTFYEMARRETVGLLIATGETRRCANLLLTIGIVPDFK